MTGAPAAALLAFAPREVLRNIGAPLLRFGTEASNGRNGRRQQDGPDADAKNK